MIYKSSNYKQWWLSSFTKEFAAPVLSFQSKYVEFLHIKTDNQALLEQNKMLLNKVFNHKIEAAEEKKLEYGDSLLFSYYTAKIIESTVNKQNNYVILDKGSKDGVAVNMGIVSSRGVVGIVKEVSPNFSTVISLLHSQFTIYAKLKNSDVTGMLTWDGDSPKYAQIANIANIEPVKMGDTVVTQHSLIFPPDYPIGIVEKVSNKKTGGYFILKVRILHDFEKMGNVYFVKQNYGEELNKLREREEH
jgi:rod shape-determining protein MreC